jgi:hypothetical protein
LRFHFVNLNQLPTLYYNTKQVAQCIPTRTPAQIRSHAQKYFNKVSKEQQEMMPLDATRHLSCPASLSLKSEMSMQMASADKPVLSNSYHEFVETISENPASASSKVNSALRSLHKRKAELENHLRRIKSEEQPTVCSTETGAISLGPASAALKAEQQHLRKAAKARYDLKKAQRQQNLQEENNSNHNVMNTPCASVSFATIPSKGEFDSGEVLALSLLGGSFKNDRTENTTEPASKVRRTDGY